MALDARPQAADKACSIPFHSTSLHDLAGPVNQVSATLELFQRKYQNTMDADAQALLALIRTSADRLQSLCTGIQTFARAIRAPECYCRCDTGELLDAAAGAIAGTVQRAGALITRDPLPAVMCDPKGMSSVFTELIDNAIKFRSASRPEIHVSAARIDRRWKLSFRDNGVGIGPRDCERVFYLFKRVHGDRYPGAGVGLAIARHIVGEHGGEIWVESEPERGAEFFFTLAAAE